MDRAGLSANDGPTHHGLFDIAYLRCLPNVIAMAPKDEDELVDMMFTATHQNHPTFIRYPRGAAEGVPIKDAAAAARNRQGARSSRILPTTANSKVALFGLGTDERHRAQGRRATGGGRLRCRRHQPALHQAAGRRRRTNFSAARRMWS